MASQKRPPLLPPLESLHPNRELNPDEVARYLNYRTTKTFMNHMYAGHWERPEKKDPHNPHQRDFWRAATVIEMRLRGPLAKPSEPRTTKPRESGAKGEEELKKLSFKDIDWINPGKPEDYES